jgi:beta-mannanase
MFTYLTNTKNLHNILWVYSPDQSRGNRLAYYPGKAYVDIVALDAYADDPVRELNRHELERDSPFVEHNERV